MSFLHVLFVVTFYLFTFAQLNGIYQFVHMQIFNGLIISEALQIAKFHPYTSQKKGSSFLLTCNAILDQNDNEEPKLNFVWYKDDHEINDNLLDRSRYQIDSKSTFSFFTLRRIQPSDKGNYSCVVSSPEYGTAVEYSFLHVTGKMLKE